MRNSSRVNLSRVDLGLLELFEAMMTERSVTRAAARVGMAQPSASKALDRLRRLFGDPLFVRASTAMRPTARAQDLAPAIADVLERTRALVSAEVPFEPSSAVGQVRVAMSDAAEFALLPGLVKRMGEEAPAVVLRARPLDKDRAFADLDGGRLDAVVGVFPDLPKRFAAAALFEERFVCIARAGHPRLARGLTLDAYAELPHLLVTLRDDARGAVDDALQSVGRARRVQATLSRFLAVPRILAHSDAIATVPARFASAAEGCEVHATPVVVKGWTEQLVWLRGAERDPLTAWFMALVRGVAATA